ncbi:MAG: DNA translocase FtsK 4TM domain-containing protein, partial [Spirosomaceae bacterium]|nr:DNA translocase FtsK 4TM domain-containing protein [Spirosomataceae bacterium]
MATKRRNSSVNSRKNSTSRSPAAKPISNPTDWALLQHQITMVAGVLFIALSVLMFISFVSFLFTGTADHDLVRNEFTTTVTETTRRAENTLGLFGAYISHWFIYKWFGIAAFGWLPIMFLGGYRMIFQKDLFEINLNRYAVATLFYVFFISIFFGYFVVNFDLNEHGITSGGIGFSVNNYLSRIIGWGGIFILAAALVGWLIMFHGFTEIDDAVSAYISQFFKKRRSFQEKLDDLDNSYEDEEEETFIPRKERQSEPIKTTEKEKNLIQEKPFQGGVDFSVEARKEQPPVIEEEPEEESLQLQIDETPNSFVPDDDDEEDVNEKLLKDFGLYDPTLELSGYKFPPISILSNHTSPTKVTDAELAKELEQNKNNIVETMRNFSIG